MNFEKDLSKSTLDFVGRGRPKRTGDREKMDNEARDEYAIYDYHCDYDTGDFSLVVLNQMRDYLTCAVREEKESLKRHTEQLKNIDDAIVKLGEE